VLLVVGDRRHSPAATRWLGRLCLEAPGVTLARAQLAANALASLPRRVAAHPLTNLCAELGLPRAAAATQRAFIAPSSPGNRHTRVSLASPPMTEMLRRCQVDICRAGPMTASRASSRLTAPSGRSSAGRPTAGLSETAAGASTRPSCARRTEALGPGARRRTHPAPRRHAPQRRPAALRPACAHARTPSGALRDDALVATARAAESRIGQTHRRRRSLGPRTAHAPSPHTRWTDGLIEQGLRRITAGARIWPTRAMLQAAGTRGLRRAISERHGAEYWAQRLGLAMRGPRPPGRANSHSAGA
jgi:hypothetical protein